MKRSPNMNVGRRWKPGVHYCAKATLYIFNWWHRDLQRPLKRQIQERPDQSSFPGWAWLHFLTALLAGVTTHDTPLIPVIHVDRHPETLFVWLVWVNLSSPWKPLPRWWVFMYIPAASSSLSCTACVLSFALKSGVELEVLASSSGSGTACIVIWGKSLHSSRPHLPHVK